MLVVRYAALAGLVVWLGAMQAAMLANGSADTIRIQYVCGAVIVVSLFAMKFVGPPPRAFAARLAIVLVMLTLAAYAHRTGASLAPEAAAIALGFVLLIWYVRE